MRKPMNPILTAVAVSGALSLLLGAAAGTQTDPLVTLSYLNDVNTPAILKEVDARLDTREQALVDKLNASIAQYEKDMEEQLAAAGGGDGVLFRRLCRGDGEGPGRSC